MELVRFWIIRSRYNPFCFWSLSHSLGGGPPQLFDKKKEAIRILKILNFAYRQMKRSPLYEVVELREAKGRSK